MGTAREQGENWGARADDWANCNEPAWNGVFAAVLDQARVVAGSACLDVGCGAGGALVLARARGAGVSGIDASENLVAVARRRLPGAEIAVGEMEELPFSDGQFDVVTGINSFQFAGNAGQALAEARRVCRAGGSVTVLTWGPRKDSELLSRVLPAVFGLLPQAPGGVAPPQIPFGQAGTIEDLMRGAALEPETSCEPDGVLAFANVDIATRAVMSASVRVIRHAGAARVQEAIGEGLAPFVRPDGSIHLNNRFRLVTGRRPH